MKKFFTDEKKGYALVLLYTFIGAIYYMSLDYILDIYPEISGIEMAFWSYIGASFLLIPIFVGSKLFQSFKYIDVSKASVWFLWETIFIIIGSYIFFSPVTTPIKIVGILCVLLGIYFVQKK